MNFFEHQERARRQSRRLIVLFVLAVVAIVVAIEAVLLIVVGMTSWEPGQAAQAALPLPELVRANLPLLAGGALASIAVISLASLFKTAGLRSGGGQVARQLGGTLVESDTRDARRRRLRNVVEEIALASGVPVPEIYVLEQESGINAFAAGFTPSDAAVAVTRGALEKLSRSELQGVIAHEFSHILNGDMRLNIRLMGLLFGILLLALIGRRVLIYSNLGRSSRDRGGGAIVLIAFGLTAIGYIGQFFGRWIKAAVSRQREYLADASAVQFTRDPDGIGGALKKIAVYSDASYLAADSEEVSHMLFGDGRRMLLFSTHPPLEDRIRRIDPQFSPGELEDLASRIQREQMRRQQDARRAQAEPARTARGAFDAGGIVDVIGNPDLGRMLAAAAIAASLPDTVRRAAHSTEWAPEVLFYTLLDAEEDIREQQLLLIAQHMGADSEGQVRALLQAAGLAAPEQRLPLLGIAFPALKRRPPDFVARVLATVEALIAADGRTEIFEFLLARVIALHLQEANQPHRVEASGRGSLADSAQEALQVLAVLAQHGGVDGAEAAAAFAAGAHSIGMDPAPALPAVADWVAALDTALPRLDRLQPQDKERLVRALAAVATHDDRVVTQELELLRAVCDLIHVPLPLFDHE